MTDEATIALITAGATIAGGLVGQAITIFYQGRINDIERIRIVQARASQLYDREIRAYDALVPGLAGLQYVARDALLNPLLSKPRQNDETSLAEYHKIQDRVRAAVQNHLKACGENYHIIGSVAVNAIDHAARTMYRMIDESTAPISNGDPLTNERRSQLLNSLEDLRRDMLEKFWSALDTNALESSFKEMHEPLSHERIQIPTVLKVEIQPDDIQRLESSHIQS